MDKRDITLEKDKFEGMDEVEIENMIPIFYTNSSVLNMSTYDLIISFFLKIADNSQEQVKVIMSPQYAKSLIKLLNSALDDYEDAFGELNIESKTSDEIIEK